MALDLCKAHALIPLPWPHSLVADDDGSGTTSTIHAFKALNEAGYVPTDSDLEFHWFSAEEGGLLGSQAIAKEYEAEGVVVKAMVQMDMTAWVKKGTEEVVGIITDFVDPALSEFMTKAVGAYREYERFWDEIQDRGLI